MKGVRWPGAFASDLRPSRKRAILHEAIIVDASEAKRFSFFHDAYVKIYCLFGLNAPTRTDVAGVLGVNDAVSKRKQTSQSLMAPSQTL
jgi:hypothetical protein